MSSKGYATPLRLEVSQNRLLRRLFLIIVTLGEIILLWLSLSQPFSLAIGALFLVIAVNIWMRRSELGGPPVSLVWDGEQRWWWSQSGKTYSLTLLGDSYLSPSLVVLNFRQRERRGRYAVVLTPAAVGEELFRRLIVRLKLHRDEALDVAKY